MFPFHTSYRSKTHLKSSQLKFTLQARLIPPPPPLQDSPTSLTGLPHLCCRTPPPPPSCRTRLPRLCCRTGTARRRAELSHAKGEGCRVRETADWVNKRTTKASSSLPVQQRKQQQQFCCHTTTATTFKEEVQEKRLPQLPQGSHRLGKQTPPA